MSENTTTTVQAGDWAEFHGVEVFVTRVANGVANVRYCEPNRTTRRTGTFTTTALVEDLVKL